MFRQRISKLYMKRQNSFENNKNYFMQEGHRHEKIWTGGKDQT